MIDAFGAISRTAGGAPVSELAYGIWTALITTAAGLVVAIPCHVAHNYLVNRLHAIVGDMERAGIEVIHVLTEPRS
jgi:biopolymer transport protein ExbB